MIDRETYQCIGCGAQIQTEAPQQPGYLPQAAFSKGIQKGDFYCQRCFRLRHYNEFQSLDLHEDFFLDRVSSISHEDAYVYHMIDIMDVEGSLIQALPRLIGGQAFSLLVNKMDLLPDSVKEGRIRHWLDQLLAEYGLRPQAVYLISTKDPASLQPWLASFEDQIRQQDVYIVGVTNVGKSTLINQVLTHYGGEKNTLTSSVYPGTTLDFIDLPLTDQTSLYDSPGIIRRQQVTYYLSQDSIKKVLPSKPVKARTFQLKGDQSLWLAGLARLDFQAGEGMAATFYLSNDLYIHRTKTSQAASLYTRQVTQLLDPPNAKDLAKYPHLVQRQHQVRRDQDFAIAGLGWFTVNRSVQLVTHLPAGVDFATRPRMI